MHFVSFHVHSVGLCGIFPRATYDSISIPQSRRECFSGSAYKPSIGNDGKHCVCVKPAPSAVTRHPAAHDEFAAAKYQHDLYLSERDGEVDTGKITDVHELWQKDFEDGTYRIQRSGTYKVMEDIVFDFNAGDLNDPSAGSSWWPTSDQIDEYPGAGTTRGLWCVHFVKMLRDFGRCQKMFENAEVFSEILVFLVKC